MSDSELAKDILLHDVDDEHLLTLRDNKVLEEDYAYGHETRQVAARRWFLEHFSARIKNESSALMFRLACRVDSTEPSNWPFVRALMWFASLADELKLDDVTRPLGVAAASLVFDVDVNTNLRLSAVRLCVTVAAYIETLQRQAAPPTVKQHIAVIRMLFSWLTKKGVPAMNPAREVKIERFSRTEGKTLSHGSAQW